MKKFEDFNLSESKKELADLKNELVKLRNQFNEQKGLVTKEQKAKIDEMFTQLIFEINRANYF